MFKDLHLESKYTSDECDIAKEFYNPVLGEAVQFDRTSAYFSAKALASYATGLEFFGNKGGKYRLVISKDISEEDFNQIKLGYEIKDSIKKEMLESFEENLSLSEEKQISNLAFFIANGTVDIKIAFKREGIFHDKCGILYDENKNIICFTGSNNETEAAIINNYESFQVVCSWLDDSEGFYVNGIKKSQSEFEKIWNNQKDNMVVIPADEAIINAVVKYNKGKIIVEEVLLENNAVILDYDEQLILKCNTPGVEWLTSQTFYKTKIKNKVEKYEGNSFFFRRDLAYPDFINIDSVLDKRVPRKGYSYYSTQRFKDYVKERNLHIQERSKLGIELKTDSSNLKKEYEQFKSIVDANMDRKLRDKQMRDAFFMFSMTKSGNFSVPGSGKTTSALAVYCFLKHINKVDRVVMIGPKNAFGSWIDEFKVCFGEKEQLRCFNIQDSQYKTSEDKIKALKYDSGSCNLFLINYEGLASCVDEVARIASSRTLLVYDEVHKVKAIDGQRAGFALKVAEKAPYIIAMTGTPIPNSYLDIYNLLTILYKDEYRDFFGFDKSFLRNPRPTDIDTINDKIQPFFCRTSKKELSVPEPNIDEILSVNTSEDEQRLFEIINKKYRSNKLALFIRILQMESNPKLLLEKLDASEFDNIFDDFDDFEDVGFADFSDEVKTLVERLQNSSKKESCISLVEKLVSENKKLVIWCYFTDSIYSISDMLNDRGIKTERILGEVPLEGRLTLISKFRNGEFDVLVTNPHTLAESVSLHTICHDAIYFEYSYNLVHLLQSKDRIHRLGLPDNQYTQYYFLQDVFAVDGEEFSMDRNVYDRLKLKEQRMLDAIDNQQLEPVYTTEEDLDLIFGDIFKSLK